MLGFRWPGVLKYAPDAASSCGLSEVCPSLPTSAWVCTSMATSESRSISGRRRLRGGDPVRLEVAVEVRRPAGGDAGSAPPAVAEGDGLLRRVRPERQAVAADAD